MPEIDESMFIEKPKGDRLNKKEEKMGRRDFLSLGGWLLLLGGSAAFLGKSILSYLPNILYEPSTRYMIGRPDDFDMGVSEKFLNSRRIWVIRNKNGIYAMEARCTHLGCTPSWSSFKQKIECPCHGSYFTLDGDVISGPAPEPLYRFKISLNADGKIEVNQAYSANKPERRESPEFLLQV